MRRNRNNSIPELLKILWHEDFFKEYRDSSEITKAFGNKGCHFGGSSLSVNLLRAVKPGGFLTRTSSGGKWKYIQKYQPSSIAGQRTNLFTQYDFHPKIKNVAYKQFENGDFKGAIQNALVEVIDQVKIKTGHPKDANGKELDGDNLMNQVFGCYERIPKIKFNKLESSLDKVEQTGLMNLFKGIVGVRDKKAHLNFIQSDPLKTIEYLSLASLLMRLLDEHSHSRKK